MKVRITNAPPGSWYENEVGNEIEVVQWGNDYVLLVDYERGWTGTWRHLSKEDCEIIKATD